MLLAGCRIDHSPGVGDVEDRLGVWTKWWRTRQTAVGVHPGLKGAGRDFMISVLVGRSRLEREAQSGLNPIKGVALLGVDWARAGLS